MKNKPTRHKDSNTFKFKPFSQRINDIDVDVFHKVSHRNEEVSEETETYFFQCVQKWNFLNLSGNYVNLRKEIKDIVTLPQLLNQKQHVIDVLLKYLKLKDPLCLQTVFDLIIAVAKDLQLEFYSYFPIFLEAIIDLLQIKDAEQLEHTLHCLAYLFKFLWRYMIKNSDTIFTLLLPLLTDRQPDYVNNFAAESFAFVVRKVKNKPAFFKLVLNHLNEKQDGIVGCGKLMFHVLAGVPGQFHSCAEPMLDLYFNAIQDPEINQELLFDVLSVIFECIIKEIHYKNCEVLWTVVHKVLEQFPEEHLIFPLRLIQNVLNYKGGQMLQDPVSWAKRLTGLIDKYRQNVELLGEIANASVATLLGYNVQLLQETSSFLIFKLFSIDNQDLLFKITEKLIDHSSFETLVLPHILKLSSFAVLGEKSLGLFVKIIETKSPPSLSGENLDKWNLYSLSIKGLENVKFLTENLDSLKEGRITESALRVLIVLPHLRLLHDELRPKVIENVVALSMHVVTKNEDQQRINFAFLLFAECLIHMTKPDDLHALTMEFFADFDLLSTVVLHDNDVSMLNVLDLVLSYLQNSTHAEDYINENIFDQLHASLARKLGSPSPLIRRTVSHIFSLFSETVCPKDPTDPKSRGVLELPYLSECEPATVHKYRDRSLHLQALELQQVMKGGLDTRYYDVPLHYLFGNLYVNFSLLWDKVCHLITSYAVKECESFWEVFMDKLKTADSEIITIEAPGLECEVLKKLADRLFSLNEKIDRHNYKLLIWKCMGIMGQYCETKNRDYVGLFIDFVQGNFFRSNSEIAWSCNIKKKKPGEQQEVMIDLDATEDAKGDEEENEENDKKDDEKEDEEEVEKDETTPTDREEELRQQLSRTERIKFLLAMLKVFGKFTNPLSLYRESEVVQIYLDLLSSKNSEIQKAALGCLYTYKYNYLLPYRAQLNAIVDEKNMKNELARFYISAEDGSVVLEEHRAGLMPVLMRILHAKMTQRVGMRTGGKGGGHTRRKIILSFLAGVKETEMMTFVQMAFKPFQNYLPILNVDEKKQAEVDIRKMVEEVLGSVNLENVIPPKRLQSAVNLLAIIIEQFGGKMTSKLLPYLFAILMCVLAQITGILRQSADIHQVYLSSIREARKSCIKVLARFFEHFENYDWSSNEIDALFEVAVFPWLNKLPNEGVYSPTPLLKMMSVWSHNPRYYPLFAKLDRDNNTPLVFVVKLLLNPKTKESVLRTIVDMFEKMLTLQDFEKEEPNKMEVDEDEVQKPKSLLPVVTNKLEIATDDLVNYGSALLVPHVTDILLYLQRKLSKDKRGRVNRAEMTILSRVSEFTTEPKICDTLLSLTLPILKKQATSSEEIVTSLLTTVTNLVAHVEDPKKHLRPSLQLLGLITHAPARLMLMTLLQKLSKGSEFLKTSQQLLKELNAFEKGHVERPDFDRRLAAFEKINQLIEKDEITLELGVAIILNSYFFLQHEKDLALTDRSGECIKSIAVYLAKKYRSSAVDRKYLIDETILSTVRRGIRSRVTDVRHQSIDLLRHMAMECPEVHPVFRDLHPLTNKQDPEVDFFENIRHMQKQRRGKALWVFCAHAKTLAKPPDTRVLTQFILPLASSFLCEDRYVGAHTIIHVAIQTVGVICRLLPWKQYEVILKYYLAKLKNSLDYQKQIIKIIIAILDNFHYDLSKYKEDDEKEDSKVLTKSVVTKVGVKEVVDKAGPSEEDDKADPELVEPGVGIEEQLDEALQTIEEAGPDDATAEEEPAKKDVPVMERDTVLSRSMARNLVNSIKQGLLPALHRCLAVKAKHEGSHKATTKKISIEREEEDLMRVPIALPMVKLLQKLPEGLMNSNLRGIFMKVCIFLKSHLDSVRKETRENLKNIMMTLGPQHLHHLINEMKTMLTRGFQVHVLAYTLHAILEHIKSVIEPRHVRSNLKSILHICKMDLFGPSAEEKEVVGVVKKVFEAKSTKSYAIFNILGQRLDEECIADVMEPQKEVLLRTHSHKSVRKVAESLRMFGLGLSDNKFIQTGQMLNFLQSLCAEYVPQLLPENKKKELLKVKEEKKSVPPTRKDCFILPPTPKRASLQENSKISKNTNIHIMVEFGLMLFHIILKRSQSFGEEVKPTLNNFVSLLNDCLKLQQVKLGVQAIRCLRWVVLIDLPMVRKLIAEISAQIVTILHKYGGVGLAKGENLELKTTVYKTMSIIEGLRVYHITTEQLKILLVYIERDMICGEKHAFSMLKAIIKHKRNAPEIHQSMEKVREMMVTSEIESVRQQSQTVLFMYLKNYELGKKFNKNIIFMLTQLKYEVQIGRLSVLTVLYKIVSTFTMSKLEKVVDDIFEKVCARLIEDEDPKCREECANLIIKLLERLEHNQREHLFSKVLSWFAEEKITKRELAAEVCGLFLAAEEDKFESRLEKVLPLISKQFCPNDGPGRFVRTQNEVNNNFDERSKDHHLIQVLELLVDICTKCPKFVTDPKYKEYMNNYAEFCQHFLRHPHLWVRVRATRFFGYVFVTADENKVIHLLNNSQDCDPDDDFLYVDPNDKLRTLIEDFRQLLLPETEFEHYERRIIDNLNDLIVSHLVFIAKLLKGKNVNHKDVKHDKNVESNGVDADEKKDVSLTWLVKKMKEYINRELARHPKSTTIRIAVFKWIAGVIGKLGMDNVKQYLPDFMLPLVREFRSGEDTLKTVAKEVLQIIKKNLPLDEYTGLLNKVTQNLDVRKARRKQEISKLAVVDPERAAKRKIAWQQKKKVSKKRRMEIMKGKKSGKIKRKRKADEIDSD
ncbi:small subunit processome component 20 homolog [Copidosoma floridanum]|uniref:small subunit processome component 20 homolog n=1 Tax=Copidosoma floridanum TaxID=29053 RepID=UPI0006C9AFF8|nr:small subunit processome component 20 homolog [Copidosoma floridanum]